jgi:RHS repeat-associated protein
MKTSLFLIFGFLVLATICRAQDVVVTNAGWFSLDSFLAQAATNPPDDGNQDVQLQANVQQQTPPTPPIIAEYITPEIQALADGLQDNPVEIYNYVHDHIRFTTYFGSKKGAQLTLLEKSGNDFDQCALLVALLRAAGYSSASYQFGWMCLPYDNPDGSDRDIHHWFALNVTNSSWSTTASFLDGFLINWSNYPMSVHNFDNNTYALQRVWVSVTVGTTNYLLDPAFKVSEPIPGINLAAAMGFSSNSLMVAAGGTETTNYVTNLDETTLRGTLAGYTANLRNYIQTYYPNASMDEILSGQYIVPAKNTALTQMYFAPTNMYGTMPVTNWVNLPTNLMSTFTVTLSSTNYHCFMPQLQGQRLSLTISSTGSAQLWLEDSNVVTESTGGGTGLYYPTLNCSHPRGSWNTTNNTFNWGTLQQAVNTQPYKAANASYAILYCFDPDWGWLQERQKQLEAYQQQGLSATSRQVVTETLNVMGLNWQLQVHNMSQMLAKQIGVLPRFFHRIGRMSQESGAGYYVDVYMISSGSYSTSNAGDNHESTWFDLFAYFGSAMEHGVIEQLQSANLVAASTIKMLQLANANHEAIYLVNTTNWPAVKSHLENYSLSDLTNRLINAGFTVLLPQNGSTPVDGTGSWTGYGFLARNYNSVLMAIGQGEYGGYVSDPSATVDPTFINYDSYSQPLYYSSAPVFVPNVSAADPVNMADGTFQAGGTDLSLGQTEPRGLSFSRYYNSSRRNSNLAGLAPGWVHNYYLNAANISSPQAGLGGTTPAQAAPMLAATAAAIGTYDGTVLDPKNWMVTTLTAKWAIDQLTAKAVSVSMGKDTIQFIQQPDGSFTPPANCTMTLTQAATNAPYVLQERHGRTFTFNGSGWATNIADQYNQSLKLAYNASNWVQTATDWKGRTLTFTYSSTAPKRLLSVADNTGRSISFGYSSGNDLASVTDPEGKTSTFLYDTNHQIIVSSNAVGQVVVSNVFNSFGRVTTQYTEGSLSNAWHIFWSGWQTVSQDPAGGQTTYFYDDQARLVAQQDALGNLTQSFYDGQNHVTNTVSPLNETNQFIYDGNNNLVQTIDPLGSVNTFVYDSQNNLVQAIDPLSNPNSFGYNSQFQLIGQTNGAGDWINYSYDTGDGVLLSRVDAVSTNTYGYDSTYRRLNSITYANGLGSESFANSSLGDVTSHTDARGFSTIFQYNNRRQLTNTVAPTNVAVTIAFDAVGNQASVTDARKVSYTNIWTATRKLSSVIFPATAQGTATITNLYDNRDSLVETLDAYKQPTLYTNDLAGRLISASDPFKRTSNLGYDGDGHQLFTVNAAGETNSQTRDARGKLIQLTDGAGHFSTRVYDAAGNQTNLINRNGKTWQFQFDAANRVHTVTSPRNHQTVITYNHAGLPSSVTDAAQQPTYFYYDAKKRLTNRTDNVAATYYSYDANDNGVNVSENCKTNTWTYDAYNRVQSYQDVNGFLLQYRYDANGNLTNLVYPGGRNVFYSYDSFNHLTNVMDWSGRKSSFAYDLNSHVTSIVRPNASHCTMAYDNAGQCTNVLEQMSNSLPIAIFKYGWTNTGNMGFEFVAPQPHVLTVPTRTMTYDDDNRLLTVNGQAVASDSSGNLTNAPLANGLFATLAYDARNRLINVTQSVPSVATQYAYDALGNRVAMTNGTTSTTFVVNPNSALPQVLMRIRNGVTNYYIYGSGLLYQITETATGTNTLTYHYDSRGSTIALSGDNGVVTDRIEYSLYALITYRIGTNDTPFLFNGKYGVQTDANGLLYMRARYYNPYLCRFVSPDPSGFGGGLNMFAYASGNPVSYIDPYGLGALQSSVDLSWFNAPTPEQQEVQSELASFVNFVTLGVANIVSSATTGQDLMGNNLNVADAVQNTLEAGAFVASLALSLPTDGGSIEADVALVGESETGLDAAGSFGMDLLPKNNLGGTLASPSQLSDFAEYLGQNGIDLQIGDEYLPANAVGGFNAGKQTVTLGDNPTVYQVLHESLHVEQFLDVGPEAYTAQTTVQKEQYVFDRLSNSSEFWDSLNFEEQQHSIWYIQSVGGIR